MNTMADDIFSASGKQILFLVGVPRSGTTWLQSMLAGHPAIGTSQESHLFDHFIGPMIERWNNILSFNDGRGGIGLPAYLTQQEFEQMLAKMIWKVLSHSQDFQKCRLFVEKTPDHIVHLEQIARIIPSARFVYMERKPQDVIESLLAAGKDWGQAWAPQSTFSAIRLFNNYRKIGLQALEQLPQQQLIKLSYEVLRQEPREQLARVLEFAGVEYTESHLDTMTTHQQQLHRYGEFAQRNGHVVIEPSGFRRKNKARLSWFQRVFVQLSCGCPPRRIEFMSLVGSSLRW